MSRSDSPQAIWQAEEERLAALDAEQARTERRLAVRPVRKRSRKTPSKPSDGFDVAAKRIEAKAERDAADAKAAKAARRAKAAECEHGLKVTPGSRMVDDPLEPGAKLKAVVNLAEHPLEMMLARRRLTQAQYEAGIRFRAIYEHAMIGPGRGIDPGKIKVDGGKMGDPLSDAVLHAHGELKRILPRLGRNGSDVVLKVCGQGMSISDLAKVWPGGDSDKLKIAFIGPRLKEALDVLAEEVWGATGPDHGRISGERYDTVIYDEQAVAVANQSYLRKRGISL